MNDLEKKRHKISKEKKAQAKLRYEKEQEKQERAKVKHAEVLRSYEDHRQQTNEKSIMKMQKAFENSTISPKSHGGFSHLKSTMTSNTEED